MDLHLLVRTNLIAFTTEGTTSSIKLRRLISNSARAAPAAASSFLVSGNSAWTLPTILLVARLPLGCATEHLGSLFRRVGHISPCRSRGGPPSRHTFPIRRTPPPPIAPLTHTPHCKFILPFPFVWDEKGVVEWMGRVGWMGKSGCAEWQQWFNNFKYVCQKCNRFLLWGQKCKLFIFLGSRPEYFCFGIRNVNYLFFFGSRPEYFCFGIDIRLHTTPTELPPEHKQIELYTVQKGGDLLETIWNCTKISVRNTRPLHHCAIA